MEKISLNTLFFLPKTNTQKGFKLMSYYTIVENGIKKANPKTKNQIIWKNPDQIDDPTLPSNPLFSKYAEELEQERRKEW